MFRWKHYVYEVYKEKSFSKAAQNLYISQPSLSARIKKIEDALGVPLFDRSTTPLRLTESGKVYVQAAEEISQIEQRVENYINNLTTLRTGHLSVGASNLFAAYVLPSLITKFKESYPDISIQLTEGNTTQLELMLSNNSIDFVIDNYNYDPNLYDKELYCHENILLAVPKTFSLNKELSEYQLSLAQIKSDPDAMPLPNTVPLECFSEIPFILLTLGNDSRTRADKLCREAGFRPNVVLELNQQATAYMASSTQLGATFISDTLVMQLPSFENLVYYRLSGIEARRDVFFYYKKHKFKTRVMEEFLSMMHKM